MVACPAEHFNFNEEITSFYGNLNLNRALCPPLGQTFEVKDKFISSNFTQIRIGIARCNSTGNVMCANDTLYNSVESASGGFYMTMGIINNNVNAHSEDYKTTYI